MWIGLADDQQRGDVRAHGLAVLGLLGAMFGATLAAFNALSKGEA